ncbi:MAG TPA: mechanosensitive ion channel domain-containing protein [Ignavibacteriaceae bacterium]|nr:mechanosensitive ion channel domain-containing protein [Ignavibacteriaceae bacterium]
MKETINNIKDILNIPITQIGTTELTLWTVVYFIILVFLLFYLTGKIRKWIVYRVFAKSKIELGVRIAVGSIIRYLVLAIGLIILLQTIGIDLSALTVLAGALGVGIGFGLQNITNNFVSGIIILFERPIKVGDRIEIGDVSGDVVSISMRSTTIVTNDNISIIVPNSDFISSKVINWSHNDRNIRFNIPVGVSYKEKPEIIRKILLEIADENKGVLKEPKPSVLFKEYGESALVFNLRIWTKEYINRPNVLKSQIYFEMFKKFEENHIEVPFPQRDLHIKNEEIKVKTTS